MTGETTAKGLARRCAAPDAAFTEDLAGACPTLARLIVAWCEARAEWKVAMNPLDATSGRHERRAVAAKRLRAAEAALAEAGEGS